jgi:hypothetical protein
VLARTDWPIIWLSLSTEDGGDVGEADVFESFSVAVSAGAAGDGTARGWAAIKTSRLRTAGKTEADWPVFTKQVR